MINGKNNANFETKGDDLINSLRRRLNKVRQSATKKSVVAVADSESTTSQIIKCMYPRRINADMIQFLPLSQYSGPIELVETDAQLDEAIPQILREKILGFDTETRPNFKKGKQYPVSILQLGGESKVWVIRLDPLKHRLADIYEVLENPSIKKAGLAVHGDLLALKDRWAFSPAGFVDVAVSTSRIGVINTGMRNLAALIFGERISKAAQLTNWASDNLTEKQIEYAATDAWMSRRLFVEIKKCIETTNIIIEPEQQKDEHFNFKSFVGSIIKKITGKVISPKKTDRTKSKNGAKRSGGSRRRKSGKPRSDGKNFGGEARK